MKKVFAVLFVAASIVLTSCGGAKTETSSADSAKADTATVVAPVDTTAKVDTAAAAPVDTTAKK
jgi:hypothetical protein